MKGLFQKIPVQISKSQSLKEIRQPLLHEIEGECPFNGGDVVGGVQVELCLGLMRTCDVCKHLNEGFVLVVFETYPAAELRLSPRGVAELIMP